MHKKKGDTLIEVGLAIGIFSMVAITIVSVVSASTAGAQSSLELTLTREEMDAQAEALRFIHDSYINGSQSKDPSKNVYSGLWDEIKKIAKKDSAAIDKAIKAYNPDNCSSLYPYAGRTNDDDAFIVNTRALSDYAHPSNIIITASSSGGPFYEAATYPRIVYSSKPILSSADIDESLYGQTELNPDDTLRRAEGIYIVAVQGETSIVSNTGSSGISSKPSYYDFYIRSCWTPPGAERPSTISTVIRLYDPTIITY